MSLNAGKRLGPYEVLSPLGAGGMGEVYRARDTRLGREVAVKVLPQHLSSNPEVRARFEREAKTVSSLNHPHICTLFDIGREGGTDYLVMELIEGETLAERLAKRALPTPEVLRIGAEIADALDKAHRAGVVHRDLKPGNVMLTKSGAKLMDFGLARATGLAGGDSGSGVSMTALTQSPTMAQPLTAEGTIVGTFQYMAPEQLEGKEAGVSADIWALGCVLYEMATGRRAFSGASQASLITSIMGSKPAPISQAVPVSPPALDRLVEACLAKDPADRIQNAHDLKLQLDWIAEGGWQTGATKPAVKGRPLREVVAWVVAALAVVAAGAAVFVATRTPPEPPLAQALLEPPPGVLFSSSTDNPLPLAISPDGSTIAFCARNGQGPDLLWVRSLGAADAHPLAGTESAQGPFFSPDGKSLGFFANAKLKRVDVAGGPVITLADDVDPRGGTWNRAGDILFTSGALGPVSRVSSEGGPVTAATTLDAALTEKSHRYPHFLPDGRHFLYLARHGATAGSGEAPTIYAGELGSNRRTEVLHVASNIIYSRGHLIYVRGTVLVAQRFDTAALKIDGPAVPLVDEVRIDKRFSRGVFAASESGVLLCMTGSNQTRTQLRWLDRSGRILGDVGEPADYTYGGTPSISPDGRSAVLSIANPDHGTSDIWLVDLETGRRNKLTVDNADHPHVAWLSDGKSVAVPTNGAGNAKLDALSIDGTRSWPIIDSKSDFIWPMASWRDVLLYWPEDAAKPFDGELYSIAAAGRGKPTLFAKIKSEDFFLSAQFSPDGRFVAYTAGETGRNQVYVAAYPQPGGRWQVSQGGGRQARWNRNGRELFYIDPGNFLVSVEIIPSAAGFQTGSSRKLFQFHGASGLWPYDVAPDGNRFLVTVPREEDLASPVTLITDWTRKANPR
ncbi:MAG TPA: protein kinase [Candidatus Polarisedimenticolia bacterium]|nr:protein kinase [Candidatus Polarisedimenticolia bacterium]